MRSRVSVDAIVFWSKNPAPFLDRLGEVDPSEVEIGPDQRLYIGNLASGEHEIVAIFTGKGPNNRDYRRGESIRIEKGSDPQFVELQIIDDPGKEQPKFKSKVWE